MERVGQVWEVPGQGVWLIVRTRRPPVLGFDDSHDCLDLLSGLVVEGWVEAVPLEAIGRTSHFWKSMLRRLA